MKAACAKHREAWHAELEAAGAFAPMTKMRNKKQSPRR
jgi:hypothetical protein